MFRQQCLNTKIYYSSCYTPLIPKTVSIFLLYLGIVSFNATIFFEEPLADNHLEHSNSSLVQWGHLLIPWS